MEDLLSARIHLVQAANAPTVEDHIHHLQASLECGLRWSKTVAAEMRRQVEASRR
ncbi:MAG: hypothetical protein JWR63_2000 [Conexibacter sp.]|nr:hypothetical protein [Conexibacter sp.]